MTAVKDIMSPAQGRSIDPQEAKRILREAMQQPGIRDLMEVYGEVRRYEDAAAEYRASMTPRTIEWATNSSTAEQL